MATTTYHKPDEAATMVESETLGTFGPAANSDRFVRAFESDTTFVRTDSVGRRITYRPVFHPSGLVVARTTH